RHEADRRARLADRERSRRDPGEIPRARRHHRRARPARPLPAALGAVAPFARSGDFWSGLVLAALGSWIVSEARAWVYMGEDGPGAAFFPVWYGGSMIVRSLLLIAGAVARPSAQ